MTSVKEMLLKGAEFLETHKWSRGSLFRDKNKIPCNIDEACSYCAIGAIIKSNNTNTNILFNEFGRLSYHDLWKFNDFRARDKREVVRYIRRLAKQL